MAQPMPWLPPVTSAVIPTRSIIHAAPPYSAERAVPHARESGFLQERKNRRKRCHAFYGVGIESKLDVGDAFTRVRAKRLRNLLRGTRDRRLLKRCPRR